MGANNVRAEWTAQKLADSETARLREQAMQKSNEKVGRDYEISKNRNAAAAVVSAGKLRDLQAIISADNDPESTSRIADPYPRLFSECATALVILDGDAKAVAGKAKALQDFARDVCVSQ